MKGESSAPGLVRKGPPDTPNTVLPFQEKDGRAPGGHEIGRVEAWQGHGTRRGCSACVLSVRACVCVCVRAYVCCWVRIKCIARERENCGACDFCFFFFAVAMRGCNTGGSGGDD